MSRVVDGVLVQCVKEPRAPKVEKPKRKGIKPQSEKRIEERFDRNETIRQVSFRANGMCQATVLAPDVPCWVTGWTAHEVVQRSVRPGSHLEPDLCIFVCGYHHGLIHDDEPRARKFGFIRDSWDVDAYGQLKPMETAMDVLERVSDSAARQVWR